MAGLHFSFSPVLIALTAVVLLVAAGAPPPTAVAAGCHGTAQSVTVDGDVLDAAAAPGAGGTLSDPFDVTWDGPISWSGATDAPIQNGTWSVSLEPVGGGLTARAFALAVSTFASGTVENAEGTTSTSGTTTLSDYLSMRATTGIYRVSWDVRDASSVCTGNAVINLTGNPWTTPMFLITLLLLLFGGLSLVPLVRLLLRTT